MVDSIVSVRMPSSLVQRLRELSEQNHFLDVSEELRSIIRYKSEKYGTKPTPKTQPRDFATENIAKQELVKRLKQMIEEIEHEK